MLENFRRAFSPGSTDCPWVSEDGEAIDGNDYLDLMALLFLSTNGEQLITLLLACFP